MRTARSVMVGWLHGAVAAFQFLTRLPVPVQIQYTAQVFRRSVVFYPLAGLAIGLLLLLTGTGLRWMLPPLPAAVLLLAVWVALTGGLHLDGLMDTADGILSHRPREQMLEIMKDSRVGAMGVIVCVLHLLLKVSLLYSLISGEQEGGWRTASICLVMIPVWSRWFMAFAIYGWPYARQESGLGSLFRGVTRSDVLLSALIAIASVLVVAWLGPERLLAGVPVWAVALLIAGASVLLGWLIATYISRKLGGLTGDTYGALNELLEGLLLLAVVIMVNR
ncbi:adenosylcobinamide-GDP ribazoletransferase [Paenibacillus aestuarii]|uniref:Adenosylcobinamide-GDP ribazoletransferase n=1 Tax=Paenibacillus aestuarii TaxID=516965 RepID=A0ABW0KAK0_9BACL|nr:adenosylcobinamide-GDP ribazoletransferase [Paenibacillus aestuarii]